MACAWTSVLPSGSGQSIPVVRMTLLCKPDVALNVREFCGVKGLIPQTAHDLRGRSLVYGFFDLYLQRLHLSISLDFFFFLLAS